MARIILIEGKLTQLRATEAPTMIARITKSRWEKRLERDKVNLLGAMKRGPRK